MNEVIRHNIKDKGPNNSSFKYNINLVLTLLLMQNLTIFIKYIFVKPAFKFLAYLIFDSSFDIY